MLVILINAGIIIIKIKNKIGLKVEFNSVSYKGQILKKESN